MTQLQTNMDNTMKFINGLMAKKPSPKTPWVKTKLSIKREELIATLQGMTGEWVNCDVCESKKDPSKYYVIIDDWKPTVGKVVEAGETDSLDF